MHLKALAAENKLSGLRFWGRVLGSEADYYVIQGRKEEVVGDEVSGGDEKEGEGVNYYSFWVSSSLLQANWLELPPVTRSQLNTARRIKLMFTGNPLRAVASHPPFDGQEQHYVFYA